MAISSALGSSALLPAGLGFRNRIINGDFSINQRGFSSSANPNNAYGFDRWLMYANNGTSTYSAQSFTLGNTISGQEPSQYLRVVSSGQSATNAATIISQKIEDVRTCAGQSTAISFWAKCGTAGKKVVVELAQDFGTGGSPSSTVLTLVAQVTLSTTWTRHTLNVVTPSISGKTLGTNNNHNLGLGFWFSAGSDFNSRTGSLGIQSDTFEIWGVQLEQNLQPTPFEQIPIGVELAMCQRYYEKSHDMVQTVFTGLSAQNSSYSGWIAHRVTKRASPTTYISSVPWNRDGKMNGYNSSGTLFLPTLSIYGSGTIQGFSVYVAGSTGYVFGDFAYETVSEL